MLRRIEYVIADSPQEFCERYREACDRIATVGEFSNEYIWSPTEAYLFYNIPEEESTENNRVCCECSLFSWRKGCLLGRVSSHGRKNPACDDFTTEVIEDVVEVIRNEKLNQTIS